MILYHGTTMTVERPRIMSAEIGRDFGPAFYTTDIRAQAERWAVRKAKIQNRRQNICVKPVVNRYEWQEDTESLQVKRFDSPSMEWLDMVVRCRGDRSFRHNFDVVEGKIADDNVGETVSYVMQGIMRREDAVERLKFERINNQIAFCTEAALVSLTFLDSYFVEE